MHSTWTLERNGVLLGPRQALAHGPRLGENRGPGTRIVEEAGTMLRKQVGTTPATDPPPGEIDVAATATVLVTSESPDHPIDHAFDGRRGPGGSCWIAGE